jgi:hypothetical protein
MTGWHHRCLVGSAQKDVPLMGTMHPMVAFLALRFPTMPFTGLLPVLPPLQGLANYQRMRPGA